MVEAIVHSFRYTLKVQGQGAGTFRIDPSTGIVKLAKELDFEDLRQPHIYQLLVIATEDTSKLHPVQFCKFHQVMKVLCSLGIHMTILIISMTHIAKINIDKNCKTHPKIFDIWWKNVR